MLARATKIQILEDAGFLYSFEREIYLNRKTRKVFSAVYVEDHNEAQLEADIAEPRLSGNEWRFYFNEPSSDRVKRDLSALLDTWVGEWRNAP